MEIFEWRSKVVLTLLLQAQPSPGRHQQLAEEAFGARINRLKQELATKTQTIQDLSHTVERLQKERRNMLSGPNLRHEARPTGTKQQPVLTKTAGETSAGDETFRAAQHEKTYQPSVFAGMHVTLCVICTGIHGEKPTGEQTTRSSCT